VTYLAFGAVLRHVARWVQMDDGWLHDRGESVAQAGKRRARRESPRQGIAIIDKADRGQMILDDPAKYFAEARVRAREQVERDLQREQRLQSA
jgi:uncharacterized Ntn-hydrolase superfamily protein